MKKAAIRTKSEDETKRLGEAIGHSLVPGDIVALTGDLGSGKTCLTKGLAKSLGVSDRYEITSPTFTIVNEYPARGMNLWHVDAYRLESAGDILDAGFEDFLGGRGVVVIEWAEKIMAVLPPDALVVSFEYIDDTTRMVSMKGNKETINRIVDTYSHQ